MKRTVFSPLLLAFVLAAPVRPLAAVEVVIIDWPAAYGCVQSSLVDQARRPGTNIVALMAQIPASCSRQLPADNTAAPFLALQKYQQGILVSSLKDAAVKIKSAASDDGSMSSLRIVGHGAAGTISVGAGEGSNSDQELATDNVETWKEDWKDLVRRFQARPNIYLQGCNVASEDGPWQTLAGALSAYFNSATVYGCLVCCKPDINVESLTSRGKAVFTP